MPSKTQRKSPAARPARKSAPKRTPKPKPERPGLVADYGIARTAKGLLPWSWAVERLAAARNYWIATTRPDGRPHVAPVWGVWLDDAYYFSTAKRAVKALNLAANPALIVHLESGDEVVILEGMGRPLTDSAQIERFDDAYAAKYGGIRPGRDMSGSSLIVILRAQVAYGWRESDFNKSATRWKLE